MVQQLMRDGNCLSLLRNASPIGLKAIIICKFSLTRFTKKANKARGLKSAILSPAWAMGRTCCKKKKTQDLKKTPLNHLFLNKKIHKIQGECKISRAVPIGQFFSSKKKRKIKTRKPPTFFCFPYIFYLSCSLLPVL